MAPRPCLVCGVPTDGDRCDAHRPVAPPKASPSARGYDYKWARLSRLARQVQPWCSKCRATSDLTADHLVWPAATLADVQVLCRRCNSRKGAHPTRVTPKDTEAIPRPLPQETNTDRRRQ